MVEEARAIERLLRYCHRPTEGSQIPTFSADRRRNKPCRQDGRLAFNPSERMRQGRIERVEVGIARSKDFDEALSAGLLGPGVVQMKDIRTSPFMTVELRGYAFDVTALAERNQLLDPTARREFDVLPRLSGTQKLQLSVSMRIPYPIVTTRESRCLCLNRASMSAWIRPTALSSSSGRTGSGLWPPSPASAPRLRPG